MNKLDRFQHNTAASFERMETRSPHVEREDFPDEFNNSSEDEDHHQERIPWATKISLQISASIFETMYRKTQTMIEVYFSGFSFSNKLLLLLE